MRRKFNINFNGAAVMQWVLVLVALLFAIDVLNDIRDNGLKSIINEIWEGPAKEAGE